MHSNDRPCLLFPGQIMMWVLVLYFGSLALLIQSLYSPSPLGSLRFFKIPLNLLTIFVNYNEFVWIFFEDPKDFQVHVINRKSAVLYINVTGVSNNLTFYGLVHGVSAHWSDQMYIKHKIYLAQDVVMWAGFPWSVYDMYHIKHLLVYWRKDALLALFVFWYMCIREKIVYWCIHDIIFIIWLCILYIWNEALQT